MLHCVKSVTSVPVASRGSDTIEGESGIRPEGKQPEHKDLLLGAWSSERKAWCDWLCLEMVSVLSGWTVLSCDMERIHVQTVQTFHWCSTRLSIGPPYLLFVYSFSW
ncbi:hypothetical protein P4O66_020070 [Electrophorus voltai]|uniref:Uncharacterized protein n=1 Tax=Electrophorus voltai TaxID=2609070 RepID=A0AAD9E3T6_9TELE|nr:hypothetical protein P4O66_020070 [Electrophorus voltai]